MSVFVVVENTRRWPLAISGVQVVAARDYLTAERFSELRSATVFNLCRTYGYQSLGYYVSLLAVARGHRPLPSVETLQDLRLSPLVRIVSEELDDLIQRAMAPLRSTEFVLSVYFGSNLARRYDRLSRALFNQFPAPFLRAQFRHDRRWEMSGVRAIATSEIPDIHREFVIERAQEYLSRPTRVRRAGTVARYDLAILRDPDAADSPSNAGAIRRFVKAARELGMRATQIGSDDYGRVAEFDALFIRETTYVDHHTYRFARRASAQGLVVIDDPESIVRCTNKVYQAEMFARQGIPSPRTLVVHERNAESVETQLGLPCVLKRPDSSFSRGVVKVETHAELRTHLEAFFEDSELVVAQAWEPSSFDWRVGVLGGAPLWAAKYHMARGHWQIAHTDARGERRFGRVESVPLADAPRRALDLAVRATRPIGEGLYGVDIKQLGKRFVVMEVNDNPNLDAGFEDAVLKDELYLAVMRWFRQRLDARGEARS